MTLSAFGHCTVCINLFTNDLYYTKATIKKLFAVLLRTHFKTPHTQVFYDHSENFFTWCNILTFI